MRSLLKRVGSRPRWIVPLLLALVAAAWLGVSRISTAVTSATATRAKPALTAPEVPGPSIAGGPDVILKCVNISPGAQPSVGADTGLMLASQATSGRMTGPNTIMQVGFIGCVVGQPPPAEACDTCGPGPHWIHATPCPPGVDLISGSQALVGIDVDLDCQVDTTLRLRGPVTVSRSGPRDDSTNFPGLRPIDGHLDVLDTEILEMTLTDTGGGPVVLIAGAGRGAGGVLPATLGAIAEQPPAPALADSFFNVMFEIDVGGGVLLYNHTPLVVQSTIDCITPDASYIHPTGCLPLFDAPVGGTHVANLITADHSTFPPPPPAEMCDTCGPGPHWIHNPPCPAGMDHIARSQALVGIDLNLDCQEETTLRLRGPVDIDRSGPRDDSINFPGLRAIDGHFDVLDTEITAMTLTDTGGGPTVLTAGAGRGQGGVLRPTFGAIAEQGGTPELADSFYDVLFEVDLGGGVFLYNHTPLVVQSKIDCITPDATYVHPVTCLPLFDDPRPGMGTHIANLVTADHTTFPPCATGKDLDGDGDVDLADFQVFQLCFGGSNNPFPPGCECSDFDGDGDVDLADFQQFQLCFSGSNNPPPPGCN